jgi:hypothetical protein
MFICSSSFFAHGMLRGLGHTPMQLHIPAKRRLIYCYSTERAKGMDGYNYNKPTSQALLLGKATPALGVATPSLDAQQYHSMPPQGLCQNPQNHHNELQIVASQIQGPVQETQRRWL